MQSHFTTVRGTSKWKWMVVHRHEDFIYLRFLLSLSFIFWSRLDNFLPAPFWCDCLCFCHCLKCMVGHRFWKKQKRKTFFISFSIREFKISNSLFFIFTFTYWIENVWGKLWKTLALCNYQRAKQSQQWVILDIHIKIFSLMFWQQTTPNRATRASQYNHINHHLSNLGLIYLI